MADEKTEEATPKKKSKLLLIVIILLLLLLAGGGGAAYFLFIKKKPAPAPKNAAQAPGQAAPAAAPAGPSAPPVKTIIDHLSTFIVNLADQSGSRYLKVTMDLSLSNEAVKKEIEDKMPMIRDTIITILSNKYYNDIATPAGKLTLKRELISRLNVALTKGRILDIYFTDFVVQ